MSQPDQMPYEKGAVEKILVHDEIEAEVLEASAIAHPCPGAKSIMLQLTEGGTVLNRSGVLTLYVSNDGEKFTAYNMLIENAANSNSQTLKRVATVTRAAAGTDIMWLTPETLGAITYFKAQIAITDGATPTGNFSLIATIQR